MPTSAEVVLADVLVDLVVGVVFTLVGVRSRPCSCSLAVDGQLTALGGVSRPFSRHSLPFVMLTGLGNVVVAFC